MASSNAMSYSQLVIRSFNDKWAESIFHCRRGKGLPVEIQQRARRKLRMLDAVTVIDDLKIPPSNHLEKLKGDRRFLNAIHCYCSICRRAHGTGFSTHVVCRPDQFKIVTGTLIDYESSPSAFRSFCPRCGTHILIQGQSGDGNLAIPAGTLDGLPDLTILAHIFVAEKVDWCQINDGLPQHQGWPPGFGATA